MINFEKQIFEKAIKLNNKQLKFNETSQILIDIFNFYEKDIKELILNIKNKINKKKFNNLFDLPETVILGYIFKILWKEGLTFKNFNSYKEYLNRVTEKKLNNIIEQANNLYQEDFDKIEKILLKI